MSTKNKKTTGRKNRRPNKRQTIPRPVPASRPRNRVRNRGRQNRNQPSILSLVGGIIGKGLRGLITGFGDYKIEGNSLMSPNGPPSIVNSNNGNFVIIRHREYLQDITSTTTFINSVFPINPGDTTTFPWLSAVASSFEEYELRGMIFEFRSTSSDALLAAAAGTSLGVVVMATEYDSLEPDFTDKHAMENHMYACSSKPSISFIHPIECSRSQTPITKLYVRTNGLLPNGADLRFYDLGKFQIATQGMQVDGGVLGELWVTYEVALTKPHMINTTGEHLAVQHTRHTGITNALPFGTSQFIQPGSTFISTFTGTAMTFRSVYESESWLVVYAIVGTAAVLVAPTITRTRCTGTNLFQNGTTSTISDSGAANAVFISLTSIAITSAPAVLTLGAAGVLPAVPSSADLFVIQIPSDLLLAIETASNVEEDTDDRLGALLDYLHIDRSNFGVNDIDKLLRVRECAEHKRKSLP